MSAERYTPEEAVWLFFERLGAFTVDRHKLLGADHCIAAADETGDCGCGYGYRCIWAPPVMVLNRIPGECLESEF